MNILFTKYSKEHNMEAAPIKGPRQTRHSYITQVARWLNEPHRKRLGNETTEAVIKCAQSMAKDIKRLEAQVADLGALPVTRLK